MIGVAFSAEACGVACLVVRAVAQGTSSPSRALCAAGKPGLAPAGDSLFFASPKKSKQKKGDPQSGSPSGQPAVLEVSGVWLNSLRSNNASPDPLPSALLGPARTGWGQIPDIQSHKYAPWRVLVGCGGLEFGSSDVLPQRRHAPKRVAQGRADQGRALSERSEFARTPPVLSNAVARSVAKGLAHPARLSFAYFSLAKQRTSESPAGASPGLLAHNKNQKKSYQTCAVCRKSRSTSQRNPPAGAKPGTPRLGKVHPTRQATKK